MEIEPISTGLVMGVRRAQSLGGSVAKFQRSCRFSELLFAKVIGGQSLNFRDFIFVAKSLPEAAENRQIEGIIYHQSDGIAMNP